MSPTRILYVADPMCSWCWGFAEVLRTLEAELEGRASVELVLGGLAPDDDAPMDARTKAYVQGAWRAVEARTGARFDHSFWDRNQPRRSTWPACRAVLAAGERKREMFDRIQRAYYTEARDPSDPSVLADLGAELGFDREAFATAVDAPETHARLREDFELRDRLGVHGYPSLAVVRGDVANVVTRGWVDVDEARRAIRSRTPSDHV